MTTTDQTTGLATTCPECEAPGAWRGTGSHGVFACDECGHAEDYGCPSWCERTDHHAEEVDPEDWGLHYGPSFGPYVTPQGRTVDDLSACLTIDDADADDMSPEQLRELASRLVCAATWLEATRRIEANR